MSTRLSDGAPCAARVGVSFLPSSMLLLAPPPPSATRAAVIIADPRCDLPHAERDADVVDDHVRRAYGDVVRLVGDAADYDTVVSAMRDAAWLHFSGHGEPSVGTVDGAELQLAGREALRAEQIVVEGAAPRGVVLNGCDTGGAFGRHGLSLPAALLAAGAEQVVATTRAIPDAGASAFVRAFYAHGGAIDAGDALRAACGDAIARGADVWSAYRLVGRRRARHR